ncbi:membrane protein [Bacillus toyonensis]|uniref:hypothetical protein n=1 Tax=Bacillus toyonensis TaxID=155322 RepID=UPI0001A06FA5|nr:hypothetical protein [Bacillus toyonensis]EEL20343.1 hypothetical protein bcere0017_49260 [Bacillus cereus Rock1-3]AHA08351.1 hypothetical protein Btoyo_2375 [Bacillus toyonensis BCT-7112]KMP60812.1 membrane protein [Bacillus toyonensis]HDR7358195.1 hypothetical protein [Bacillus toyonensis]HDR7503195.1 hypothetical protein [Bacillus toyonensis]
MWLPVLCVATAIFALLWGMQNFSRNPVPSICIMIGTVGLSYYLLVSTHYHKTATSVVVVVVVVGALILFCGRAVQKGLFP